MKNSKRDLFLMLSILILIALCFSCGMMIAPVVPPVAAFYTNITAPLELNSNGGKELGSKKGEASTYEILGITAWGDAGVHAAVNNGKLTRVNHIDYHYKNYVFGVYAKYTTIVYGE